MRSHVKIIIAIVVLVAVGLAAGWLLIPNEDNKVAIQDRQTRQLERAGGVVTNPRERYEAGDRSYGVIAAYADLLVSEGRNAEAITLVEAYVRENEGDTNGLKKLALLYRTDGRIQEYASIIERVASQDPTEENLKLLADLHNVRGEYAQQITLLEKLIAMTNREKPLYLADLATVLMLEGRKPEASVLLTELLEKHPDSIGFEQVRILSVLYLDSGEGDKAYAIANNWVTNNESPDQLAILADTLRFNGRPTLALDLIEPRRQQVTSNLDLLSSYVGALVAVDRRDDAYAILTRIDDSTTLPPRFYPVYLSLALERKDNVRAVRLASKLSSDEFTEIEAVDLVSLAKSHNDNEVTNLIVSAFDNETYISDKPVLGAVIAMHKNAKDENTRLDVALASFGDTPNRLLQLRLAQACVRHNERGCYNTILDNLPPLANLTPQTIYEVSELYIAANKPSAIYDDVSNIRATRSDTLINKAWSRLAAASGKTSAFDTWFANAASAMGEREMQEYFFLANNRGQAGVAAIVAQEMVARNNTAETRSYLASAYMRSGQLGKALDIYRKDKDSSRSNRIAYESTLAKLAKNNAKYRAELVSNTEAKLNSGSVSDKEAFQLVYTLINSGNKSRAIPYAKRYASRRGGKWQSLYDTLTGLVTQTAAAKPAVKLTREQLVAKAANASTSAQKQREIAFQLINDGYKADGTRIFERLAASQGPDGKDVNQMLFLWGNNLSQEQISYLLSRAENGPSSQRSAWIQHLVNGTDDATIMQMVPNSPQLLAQSDLRKRYFVALAKQNNTKAIDTNFVNWVQENENVDALRDYIDVVTAYGYKNASIRALNRMQRLTAKSEKTLLDLAAQHFFRADYSEASRVLDQYYSVRSQAAQPETNPYTAYFFSAAMARRDGRSNAANQYFAKVIEATNAMGSSIPLDASLKRLASMFHTGYRAEAREGYHALLKQNPSNKVVLAEFVNILIDYKFYDEARQIANQYDSSQQRNNASIIKGLFDDYTLMGGEGSDVTLETIAKKVNADYTGGYAPSLDANAEDYRMAELQKQEDLRLQLLYARMELETGREDLALKRLEAIRPYFSDDAQLLGFIANIQNYSGNQNKALSLLDRAENLTPENEDIAALRRSINRQYGQFVRADHSWRRIGSNDEYITTVDGMARLTDSTEIGFSAQHNEVKASQINRAEYAFRLPQDYQVDRQRGEVYIAHSSDNGARTQGSIYANRNDIGAGLSHAFNNAWGRTTLFGEYHKPYWDFVEAVVEDATRDRVGFKHLTRINPRLSFLGEVSLNNYNIAETDEDPVDLALLRGSYDGDSIANSILLRGNLAYSLRAAHPYVGIGYGIDAEYFGDKDRYFNTDGTPRNALLPVNGREIHALSVLLNDQLTDSTFGEVVGGYAFDRLGGHGPFVEGTLTQDLGDNLEAQIRGRYGIDANDSDQAFSILGGHLKAKF